MLPRLRDLTHSLPSSFYSRRYCIQFLNLKTIRPKLDSLLACRKLQDVCSPHVSTAWSTHEQHRQAHGGHTKALGFYVWSPFSLPPLSLSKVSTHLSLLPLVSQLEFLKKKKTKAQKETTAPAMVATLATASITVVACKILSPALWGFSVHWGPAPHLVLFCLPDSFPSSCTQHPRYTGSSLPVHIDLVLLLLTLSALSRQALF